MQTFPCGATLGAYMSMSCEWGVFLDNEQN